MITINDLYTEMTDAIIDVISRNLNIRYDEIDLDARIIEDLGATPLCFLSMFIEIERVYELSDGDYFILEVKTINDLILCIKDNCDLLLIKAKQIIAQYQKIPTSNIDLDKLFPKKDAKYYTKEQKDMVRLLINDFDLKNLCLLECFHHLTLKDIKIILFEELSGE